MLTANEVYPGQDDMQSMVINSFYSQFEEEPDDDALITLDELIWMPQALLRVLITVPTKKLMRTKNWGGLKKSVMG